MRRLLLFFLMGFLGSANGWAAGGHKLVLTTNGHQYRLAYYVNTGVDISPSLTLSQGYYELDSATGVYCYFDVYASSFSYKEIESRKFSGYMSPFNVFKDSIDFYFDNSAVFSFINANKLMKDLIYIPKNKYGKFIINSCDYNRDLVDSNSYLQIDDRKYGLYLFGTAVAADSITNDKLNLGFVVNNLTNINDPKNNEGTTLRLAIKFPFIYIHKLCLFSVFK